MSKIFLNYQLLLFLERVVKGNLIVVPISHTVLEELYTVMAGQMLHIFQEQLLEKLFTNTCFKAAFRPLVNCPDLAVSYMPTQREHTVTHY
jgi:hypothetical protein